MKYFIAMALMIALAGQTAAMSAFLQRDLGVTGFMRYCEYSDGNTYTVNSVEICPTSVDVGDSFSGGGSSYQTGFKAGEYMDGLTKVCVYDVLGNQQAIRINSYELCPLSQKF